MMEENHEANIFGQSVRADGRLSQAIPWTDPFTASWRNPPGQRIEHIFRRGVPVLAGETYKAAFVTAQGGTEEIRAKAQGSSRSGDPGSSRLLKRKRGWHKRRSRAFRSGVGILRGG